MKFLPYYLTLIFTILIYTHSKVYAQNGSSQFHSYRQFRGVWIATVRNLDWPSKPGLKNKVLKSEFIKQLDKLQEIGMNAVIVQIRPVGDAMYASPYEPWSEYLTGEQGKPPSRGFDPLSFMISETHKRCMEFHAWFNPFRAARDTATHFLVKTHIYFKHPEWFVSYGNQLYFDPGMVPARKFVEKVITDVVTRYDIDAVHFDDHYYPYRLEGLQFPDTLSYKLYGENQNRESWRRENINNLVRQLFDTINQLKPWVHFGISPFGVWRNRDRDPRGSATHTLQTNYDDLYGDALKWVSEEWLDYILPQCYQYLGRPIMDYRVVTRWWNENHGNVNFYIGQGPFRLGNPDRGIQWTIGNEIVRQLNYNDSIPDLMGSSYFRSQTFLENPAKISDTLKNHFYRYPALPPISQHDALKSCELIITKVQVRKSKNYIVLKCNVNNIQNTRYFIVYGSKETHNPKHIMGMYSRNKIKLKRADLQRSPVLYLSALDRYRIESIPYAIKIRN